MVFRAAVIGLGRAGSQYDGGEVSPMPRSHVGALLGSSKFELVAVCDTNEAARRSFRRTWPCDANVFERCEHLFDATRALDVIAIVVGVEAHLSVLEQAIRARPRVLFCEKPFCANHTEARKIVRDAQKSGITVFVNYNRRWDPKFRRLRRIVAEAGPPVCVIATYSGGLLNNGSHLLDLLEFLFGPISTVRPDRQLREGRARSDPSLSFQARLDSGAAVHVIGNDQTEYALWDLDIFFESFKIRVEIGGYSIARFKSIEGRHYPGYNSLGEIRSGFRDGPVHGLRYAYSDIAAHLMGKSLGHDGGLRSALRVHEFIARVRGRVE